MDQVDPPVYTYDSVRIDDSKQAGRRRKPFEIDLWGAGACV